MHGGMNVMPKPVDITDYLRALEREMTEAAQASKEHSLADIPASFPKELRWYAFHTHPQAEKAAGESIQDLGYKAFIPHEKRIRRRPGLKPKHYEAALFPRYGFVQFDINDHRWGGIVDTDEIVDVLRRHGIPCAVPNHIIEGLQLAESVGVFDKTIPFKTGGSVEVTEGPFAGWIGKIMRSRTDDRVDVLLNILGGDRVVTTTFSSLREA